MDLATLELIRTIASIAFVLAAGGLALGLLPWSDDDIEAVHSAARDALTRPAIPPPLAAPVLSPVRRAVAR